MNIGLRIKELREERGLSQKELAEILEISRPSITKYERSEREPSYAVLLKISDFFGVSSDYLLGKTNEKDKNSYTYSKRIKELENINANEFSFGNIVLDKAQESAINGLLAQYLSLIDPDNPISLDCIYLSTILSNAITDYYYAIFNILYETDDNINFYRKEMISQTLLDVQDAQAALISTFNDTLFKIEKFTLSDSDSDNVSPAYYIDEILENFSVKKGRAFISERERVYSIFKGKKINKVV